MARKNKNGKYVSPTIQNEMITAFTKSVMREIASNIKHAFYYLIMADKVTDSSNKEKTFILLLFYR